MEINQADVAHCTYMQSNQINPNSEWEETSIPSQDLHFYSNFGEILVHNIIDYIVGFQGRKARGLCE